MRVRVVREGCIGCGQCAEICPQVFCLASDGLARVEQAAGSRFGCCGTDGGGKLSGQRH